MSAGRVVITGGSGYVGRLLRAGLAERGYRIDVFDRLRGPLVDVLRSRTLASRVSGRPAFVTAPRVRRLQHEAEGVLQDRGGIRDSGDDILGSRAALADRFRGARAVIHLAGIPHPFQRGALEADFMRLNYDGAVNVLQATRDAEVPVFVFASSAQVYKINDPVRLDHLPILESNYLPLPCEGQSTYGFLKGAFERYLIGACQTGPTQGVSLRLECPGFFTHGAGNQYISTSIENLVGGFACALTPPGELRADVFNLADGHVEPEIVDVAAYARARWPYVPAELSDNICLLSTEKAQRVLGYRPRRFGRYVPAELVW